MLVWLRDSKGLRVPIQSEGLWLGRDPACAIVLPDPGVSRRHVLIVQSTQGPRIIAVRRRGVLVNDREPDDEQLLIHGDELSLLGARFSVEHEPAAHVHPWALEHEGVRYSLRCNPFRVGGAPSDDLIVTGWPPAAATLSVVEGGVVLESECNVLGGGVSSLEGPLTLHNRDVIALNGVRLRLIEATPPGTTLSARPIYPSEAHLEYLPHGGLLRLTVTGRAFAVWLSDRRCDLVGALLAPIDAPAGDFVSDEVLSRRIWPGEPTNRLQINTLVYRLRKTLTSAGLDGPSLIERAAGGGGTRFCLAPAARVSVA